MRRHQTTVSGTLEGVIAAAEWLRETALQERLQQDLTFALEVCLEELMTNIARHSSPRDDRGARPGHERPTISANLRLAISDEEIELVVEDDGKAFDAAAAPAQPVNRPLAELQAGGLGLRFVRSFSSDLRYERHDDKNRVTLHFLPERQGPTKAYP